MLKMCGAWLLCVSICAASGSATSFLASGHCVVAQVPEPFEVNGQMYPAGTLSLRELRDYTPVATLNEVCIDSICQGMLIGVELPGQLQTSLDELIFARSPQGHLVLFGMVMRGQPARQLVSQRGRS